MNALQITKFAVGLVVGSGVSSIVHTAIKNNVQPKNLLQTVKIGSASLVLGAMAADATKNYTNSKIDEMIESFKSMREKLAEVEGAKTSEEL